MELQSRRFYERAIEQVSDASTRKLLGDLADVERKHSQLAESLEQKYVTPEANREEAASRRGYSFCRFATGAGRADGWFGFNSGASVRRRLCHAQQPPTRFWWDWQRHWERESPWDLRKRYLTMAHSPAVGIPGCVVEFAG